MTTSPKSVAIVGLGPSLEAYVSTCRALGGRKAIAEETWVINGLGDILAHDRVFHQDDVRIQQIRADAQPGGGVAVMLEWMKSHPGPIYSSRAHPDYPGLVEFPLERVINATGHAYFNSTFAYALALAVYEAIPEIHLFGADFTYPNKHDAEKGRACVEYWIAVAAERGLNVIVPQTSSLLDAIEGAPLYGYGAFGSRDVAIERDAEGKATVTFAERESLPTAAEIEKAYDHSTHPNPLASDPQSSKSS